MTVNPSDHAPNISCITFTTRLEQKPGLSLVAAALAMKPLAVRSPNSSTHDSVSSESSFPPFCVSGNAGETQKASAESREQEAAQLPRASVDIRHAETQQDLWKASDLCTGSLFPGAGRLLGSILRLNKVVNMQAGSFYPTKNQLPSIWPFLHQPACTCHVPVNLKDMVANGMLYTKWCMPATDHIQWFVGVGMGCRFSMALICDCNFERLQFGLGKHNGQHHVLADNALATIQGLALTMKLSLDKVAVEGTGLCYGAANSFYMGPLSKGIVDVSYATRKALHVSCYKQS